MIMTPHLMPPFMRYGDFVGRAAAGLIIFAVLGFAVAATIADLL